MQVCRDTPPMKTPLLIATLLLLILPLSWKAQAQGPPVESIEMDTAAQLIEIAKIPNKRQRLTRYDSLAEVVRLRLLNSKIKILPEENEEPLLVVAEPVAGPPTSPSKRFEAFELAVHKLNDSAYQKAGVRFFDLVEDLGDGMVKVVATDFWLAAPPDLRQGNLNTLFNLWDAAEATGLPIAVYIYDRQGNMRMKKTR